MFSGGCRGGRFRGLCDAPLGPGMPRSAALCRVLLPPSAPIGCDE